MLVRIWCTDTVEVVVGFLLTGAEEQTDGRYRLESVWRSHCRFASVCRSGLDRKRIEVVVAEEKVEGQR